MRKASTANCGGLKFDDNTLKVNDNQELTVNLAVEAVADDDTVVEATASTATEVAGAVADLNTLVGLYNKLLAEHKALLTAYNVLAAAVTN